MYKFERIESSYLTKQGYRLVWMDKQKELEHIVFLKNDDLEHVFDVLEKNSTDKVELEDGTSSIMINSDMVEFHLPEKKLLTVEREILKQKIAEYMEDQK